MHKVFLGIGGNIGDKHQNFIKVADLVEIRLGEILKTSSIYETPPWGFFSDDYFWNRVLLIETQLEPKNLLKEIHNIEAEFGRKRTGKRYTSREMDIDILYFEHLVAETEELIIPHPQIQNRKFVLIPLVEISPNFKHPILQLTNSQLLEHCNDESVIIKVEPQKS
ncbi:MAG: 2-amino-4-hydroxy-6-hydroxymethyldihydropteridine diphosphokinase [Prolixibacteraceae bacterium]|nr:2-amino-4-hydroxy-6-hydroxymethyldihydropteridine diphosphokinase [Prolixibacteraceae bacterium]